MTNRYIEVEMTPTSYGVGGAFHTKACFVLDNFQAPFYDIEVKIDTGCSISTIPVKRLKVSDALCRILKERDIANRKPYYLSYGVETGGLKHVEPVTDTEKMECAAMKFEHRVADMTIAGMPVPCDKICLNYDRRGNILIGMDILQNWDIHMGISNKTGKHLFIACPLERISREYLDVLGMHFAGRY